MKNIELDVTAAANGIIDTFAEDAIMPLMIAVILAGYLNDTSGP